MTGPGCIRSARQTSLTSLENWDLRLSFLAAIHYRYHEKRPVVPNRLNFLQLADNTPSRVTCRLPKSIRFEGRVIYSGSVAVGFCGLPSAITKGEGGHHETCQT